MINKSSRDAYRHVADDLRRRILDGEFSPGDKLPPSKTHAVEYGVASATYNRALEQLRNERLVESRNGVGTFVLDRSAHLWSSSSLPYLTARPRGAGDAWSEQTAAKGRVGSQRLLEVAEVEPPIDVCEALDLSEGEMAVVRRRVVSLDGVPIELADSYYPTSIARDTALAASRRIKGGAVTALADLGWVASQVDEDVVARMPTEAERAALAMDEDVPVLVLSRTIRSKSGDPFEVTTMVMPADRRRLQYSMNLG